VANLNGYHRLSQAQTSSYGRERRAAADAVVRLVRGSQPEADVTEHRNIRLWGGFRTTKPSLRAADPESGEPE
jgi:hypothetical protein